MHLLMLGVMRSVLEAFKNRAVAIPRMSPVPTTSHGCLRAASSTCESSSSASLSIKVAADAL